jgi:hypothetical protein
MDRGSSKPNENTNEITRCNKWNVVKVAAQNRQAPCYFLSFSNYGAGDELLKL